MPGTTHSASSLVTNFFSHRKTACASGRKVIIDEQGVYGMNEAAHWVKSIEDLSAIYKRPNERALRKELDHVDAVGRAFIAASPFVVLASASEGGLDCSPKGEGPGFVQVTDEGQTLLIPDRPGNNRIDGLKNLITD